MRTYSTTLFLITLLTISTIAQARDYTFSPDPADLGELAHGENYAWRIPWSPPAGERIVGATLTIKNIDNWILEPNANWLRIYLLDTPPTNGNSRKRQPIFNFAVPYVSVNCNNQHNKQHNITSRQAALQVKYLAF